MFSLIYENNKVPFIFLFAIFFFKFLAMNLYFVTLSVTQCLPVETTSEQAIMPVTITIVEVLPPPPPELISYEYTKNDTGYMYR